MGRKKKQILECRTTFVVGRRFVRRGETLPADHELVRGNERYFRPYEGDDVETATAAPGEKRDARFERDDDPVHDETPSQTEAVEPAEETAAEDASVPADAPADGDADAEENVEAEDEQ